MSATDQFTESAQLTAVAIAYRNEDYQLIADAVLPRVPAPARNFKWQKYDEAEAFTVPDTRVGRRGTPNRVEIEGTEQDGSCDDFGIDVPLDQATIDEARRNKWDPEGRATERATDIVLLDREIRVARLVQDEASYHADHVEALAAGDKFSNPDSDPVSIIEDMLDTCWMRPNQLTFSLNAWRAFRKHPKVVKAIHGNSGDEGRATISQAAELLEVQRILVGAGRVNVNRPGEDPVLERVWDSTVTGQFINRTADTTGGLTFGFTAQLGTKFAGTLLANLGLRGGRLIRSGETIAEKIVANRAGFLIKAAV